MKNKHIENINFVSSSDHEDFEREYYDRKNSGGLFSCLFLLGFIFIVGIVATIIKLIN